MQGDVRAELPAALQALAAAHAGNPVGVRRVSQLDAPRHRAAAFQLQLADGTLLKGRMLRDEATAARVQYVLARVPHPAFPRLLAAQGRAMLLEWIEGRAVEPDSRDALPFEAAAELLATLHQTPVPASCPFAARDPRAQQRARATRHLEALHRAGGLDAARTRAARDLLEGLLPAAWQVGFVHGDLCAENLVVDATGRVLVVDNESLGVDACDADLARTLYRWSPDRRGARVMLDAYAKHRSIEPLLEHFGYWALVVRLGSAAHRIGAPAAVGAAPLRSLERLMAAIECGRTGEDLLFLSLTRN